MGETPSRFGRRASAAISSGPGIDHRTRGSRESVFRARGVHTILHATSLSKAFPGPSAALAFEIGQMAAARLVLMHVLPTAGRAIPATPTQLHNNAERELRRLIPPEAPAWCVIDTFVGSGDPATAILAQAHASHADLIVLGAEKASALAALAHDGVAYRVIAHAHCPVLTLCNMARRVDQQEELADLVTV